jgi:hypothetical protein
LAFDLFRFEIRQTFPDLGNASRFGPKFFLTALSCFDTGIASLYNNGSRTFVNVL